MVNTIIFDIGNVLVPFNWQEVFEDLHGKEIAEKIGCATVLRAELWSEFDRGAKSDEAIMESFYVNAPEYKHLIENSIWEIYNRMKPYDYSENWLKELKDKGYKIYLLSNFGKTSFLKAKESFGFMKYCDGGVISYEVKAVKPNGAIYNILCEKYNINPKEAVFLDDNEDNIKAARDIGFSAVHFTTKKEADLELDVILNS